jgi:Tol biopolymer transport system component
MTLAPDSRIGPYEVRGLIGAGGMGEVYRAYDSRLGREVALKTLPLLFASDAERVARFEREARLLATLNHPNIATVHGFERQDDVLALVMELVEGETLDERLRLSAAPGRGLALPPALHIARQIISAIDAAHEKGIVHRDLKPANIKLTPEDDVKVLDFGLAKTLDIEPAREATPATTKLTPPMTRLGVVLGTTAYMSPEQARGQAVDRRTDIWAFGCILYEMLAGRPAFAGETVSDTIAAVLGADVDVAALPADVPQGVRMLIARCLERSPKARLRDIADARPFLDMPAAPPTAPAAPAPAPTTRRTMLMTGGAAALGLIGGGIGGALVWRKPASLAGPSYQRITFRRGMIRTARFGPDLRTILYGALWDGAVCRVHTVRPESSESAALPLPPAAPLAVSASGELALALGTHSRGIMTYGTLARVPLAGGAPRELQEQIKYADWLPDGSDLAVVRRIGVRDQLEFPIGTIVAQPGTPEGGFSFPRVSPGGDAVAAFELDVSFGLVGRVVIVDRSGVKRASSSTYYNVFGLAWKGDEVWFTAAGDLPLFRNTVYAMSTAGTVRIVARVPGNTSLHDIAPDGRVLIARTDDRGGISVRVAGESAPRDLSWLDAANLAGITPDGRRILFSETGVGGGPRASAYLRGTDGSQAVRLGDGYAHALSPDGRWAIVQTEAAHFDLIPTGPGQPRRLARPDLRLLEPQWLADGQHIVVRARPEKGQPRLYLLDLEGQTSRPITPEGLEVGRTGWAVSPDGTMVAVSAGPQLQLIPIAGGAARVVPQASDSWTVLGWIENGLLVSKDPQAGGVVFRLDPATGRTETWADIQPQDPAGIMNMDLATLVVTPDGRSYGYTWHRANSDLYLVEGWA